jgi:hypothetical protein
MAENNAGGFQEQILVDEGENSYIVIPVATNGWSLYLSLLTALEISSQDTPAPPRQTTGDALNLAETIQQKLNSEKGANAKRLIEILLQNVVRNDMSDEDRLKINDEINKIQNNPQYDKGLKERIIQSLILQYENDGATLEKDTDGTRIASVEDYIKKISTPKNETNLEEGPQAWPDIAVIGDIASDTLKSHIMVFQKDSDDTLIKVASFGDKQQNTLRILYVNRNNFDVLVLLPDDIQDQEGPPATDANANPLGEKQKLASFGSKFMSALQSAKKKLSLASMKKGVKDLGKKAYKAGRVLATGQFHGEIIVTGERVRLDEQGFIPGDESEITSFKTKYFPQFIQNEEQLELVKSVFKMIFTIDKNDEQIKLPCDDQEKDILLDGLTTRRETLWNELKNLYDRRSTPALLRTKLLTYERLNILIMNLQRDMDMGICQDYNPDGTPAGFRKVNLEDDKNIRELLRNFVYLILQAKMPVRGFDTNTARELVTTINENKISENEMDTYLSLWREQAAFANENIPNIIAEVLEGVDAQPGLVNILVDDELNSLYKEIVQEAIINYQASNSQLLSEFNNFLRNDILKTDTFKVKIKKLISWIQRQNVACIQTLKLLQEEQVKVQQFLTNKEGQLRKIQQELAAKQGKLLEKTAEVLALQEASKSTKQELEISKALNSQLEREKLNLEEQKVALFNAAEQERNCKAELNEKMKRQAGITQQVEEAQTRAVAAVGAAKGASRVATPYREVPVQSFFADSPAPADAPAAPPPAPIATNGFVSLFAKDTKPSSSTGVNRSEDYLKERRVFGEEQKAAKKAARAARAASPQRGGGTPEEDISILTTTIKNLKEELSLIQQTQGSCLEQAKADVQTLQAKLSQYETTNGNLNRELAEKQAELNRIKDSSTTDTSKFKKQIEEITQQIALSKKSFEETVTEHNQMEEKLRAKILNLNESQQDLEAKKGLAEFNLFKLQEQLDQEIKKNELNEAKLNKQEEMYTSKLSNLTVDIETLRSAKIAAENKAESFDFDKHGYEERNEELLDENAAIKKENREILSQIANMTQAIENGTTYIIPSSLAPTITQPFTDLYQKITSVKSKISAPSLPTLCLLSYIIKTILRQITYANPLAQQSFLELIEVSKRIMNTPTKQTLLNMINMLFTIIQFSYKYMNYAKNKMQKITVIKTNSEYTGLFKQIYNNFKNLGDNPKIFDKKRTIYLTQILFSMSDDTKEEAEIFFHSPIDNSQAPTELQDDINFIIKRYDYAPNQFDKQTYIVLGADTMNTAVEKQIDQSKVSTFLPIYDTIYADKTVSITSLTSLFIIYSMEYLKLAKDDMDKEKCVLDFSSTRYTTMFEK